MPFEPIQPEKISQTVRQIEQLILRGILKLGERLPSERELSERPACPARPCAKHWQSCKASGLPDQPRRIGVFVGDVLGSAFSETLVRLFSSHDEGV
jgi:GntR family transcriptional repressor for pyruvate dehydrogenase complex